MSYATRTMARVRKRPEIYARSRACERAESIERIMCRYRAAIRQPTTGLSSREPVYISPTWAPGVFVVVVVVVVLYTPPRGHRWASHICTRASRIVSRLPSICRRANRRTCSPWGPPRYVCISRGSSAEYARSRQRRTLEKPAGERIGRRRRRARCSSERECRGQE